MDEGRMVRVGLARHLILELHIWLGPVIRLPVASASEPLNASAQREALNASAQREALNASASETLNASARAASPSQAKRARHP